LYLQTDSEYQGWRWYYELKQSGQSTVGRVTLTEPNNHQAVHYAFQVGEKMYSGVENGHSFSPGDEVRVTYLPRDPSISCLTDPAVQFRAQLSFLVVLALLIAFATAIALWRVSGKTSRK